MAGTNLVTYGRAVNGGQPGESLLFFSSASMSARIPSRSHTRKPIAQIRPASSNRSDSSEGAAPGRCKPRRDMEADFFQTPACFWLSVISLRGVDLNTALGWWWADPAAAFGMTFFLRARGEKGMTNSLEWSPRLPRLEPEPRFLGASSPPGYIRPFLAGTECRPRAGSDREGVSWLGRTGATSGHLFCWPRSG